jgi:hypothetical protein
MDRDASSNSPPVKGVGTELPSKERHYDAEATETSPGMSSWFGGSRTRIGARIAPQTIGLDPAADSESDVNSDDLLIKQRESEQNSAIQYRTCSWQKVRGKQAFLGIAWYQCRDGQDGSQDWAPWGSAVLTDMDSITDCRTLVLRIHLLGKLGAVRPQWRFPRWSCTSSSPARSARMMDMPRGIGAEHVKSTVRLTV